MYLKLSKIQQSASLNIFSFKLQLHETIINLKNLFKKKNKYNSLMCNECNQADYNMPMN